MILSDKRLAWMVARAGGVKLTWSVEETEVSVEAAMHRHQPERSREQTSIYAPEGEVPQPHLCFLVPAAQLEGKPFADETRPVTKGMRVTATLECGDVEYRVEKCELAADQSHFIIEIDEDAE